jgi:hypothetical protein
LLIMLYKHNTNNTMPSKCLLSSSSHFCGLHPVYLPLYTPDAFF